MYTFTTVQNKRHLSLECIAIDSNVGLTAMRTFTGVSSSKSLYVKYNVSWRTHECPCKMASHSGQRFQEVAKMWQTDRQTYRPTDDSTSQYNLPHCWFVSL